MAKSSFGNTWWGKSWLNALDKIDYDNRLPRGQRYARNGSVKAIVIKKNEVTAKVQGTQPRPYNVHIAVPVFQPAEIKTLKEQIRLNTQVYAAILNKELSPDIERIAEKQKITLFPKKWSDLEMSCSCPDWAVPCKHIAAVVFQMADAIDRNPWVFFQLKGLDLEKEFEGQESGRMSIAFHQPEDYFLPALPEQYHVSTEVVSLRTLDLSKIPYLRDAMYKLLGEQPLFWKADFREEWDDRVSTTTKNCNRWLSAIDPESPLPIPELRKGQQVQIFLDQDLSPTVVGIVSPRRKNPLGYTAQDLLQSLTLLTADDLPEMDASCEALWHALNFCQALVAKGAIRPQLVQTRPNGYRIIWLPSVAAAEVDKLMQAINAAIPADLLFKIDPKSKQEAYLPTSPAHTASMVCSLFLGMIVCEFGIDTPQYYGVERVMFEPPAPTRDPIIDLFFGGMTVAFTGFGSESIPSSIEKWLGIFELGNSDLRPLLQVDSLKQGGFTLSLSIEKVDSGSSSLITLADFIDDPAHQLQQIAALRAIYLLAGIIPPIHTLLANKGSAPVPIDPEVLLEILLDKLPLVELLGVRVLLPTELKTLVRPKPSVKIDLDKKFESEFGLGNIFSFDWQVSIGDDQLSPEEFFKLLRTSHGLVYMRNQYVLIQPDELQKMRRRFERGPRPSPYQLFHSALTGEFEGASAHLTPAVQKMIDDLKEIKEMPVPAGIKATLRPYQQRGFAWMYKNARLGLGSVIADDMGLGKTLQVLTLLEQLRSEGSLQGAPALAIVPTSLLANWKKEAEKFAPELKVVVYHGTTRKFPKDACDLLVTTYGTLRSDQALLKKKAWGLLVIDEAQNIKNSDTAQTKAVRGIPARIHIAMSGTPVENRLTDYWSIFDFAMPGYLGTKKSFEEEYATPITRFRDDNALRLFHLVTAPFIMRRLKTDPKVISDLPDKIVQNQWTGLEKEQASIYQVVVEESMKAINKADDNFSRAGLVLKMLTALKQVCNHPVHYLGKGKAIAEASGKAATLLPIVESIVAQHEKCLIFTQYTEMAKLLQDMLQTELGISASFLHGGLSPKQREALVTEFQEESHRKVFILSLKAGGTGLNLTAANHVIHYDLWWNPAVENQATDRAFRIGQRKNVMVHRLICRGTLEERIDNLLNSKKELADLTVAKGENWIGDLSNQELASLVRLEG